MYVFQINPASEQQTVFQRTHFKEIGSTQDYLKFHTELFRTTDQVVVTADEQTQGRGTKNKKWASPPDVNIYATFGVKLPAQVGLLFDLAKSPAVMEIIALAVAKTLEDFGLRPEIKWRNDVLLNGKKVCGVLCEMIPVSDGFVGLIGIGLNVNMAEDICKSLDQPVTSISVELGHHINKEIVFNRLSYYVSYYINLYLKNGFSSCIPELNQRLAFRGKLIKVCEEITGNEVEGICEGVDDIGQLKLKLSDDKIKLIRWGTIIKSSPSKQIESDSEKSHSDNNKALPLYPILTLGIVGSVYALYQHSKKYEPTYKQLTSTLSEPPPDLKSTVKTHTSSNHCQEPKKIPPIKPRVVNIKAAFLQDKKSAFQRFEPNLKNHSFGLFPPKLSKTQLLPKQLKSLVQRAIRLR